MPSIRKICQGGEYLVAEVSCQDVFTPEDFNDEQKQLADTIEQFVENEVMPNVDKLENHDLELMVRLLKRSGELGLLMIDAPVEYGGLDLDKATSMLASEKISRYGGFMVSYMVLNGIGILPLIYYGTADQKEKYLERLIAGEWMSAYCLTEPDAGSDALGAKTSATLSADGKYYVLNGTKQFITNGGFADLYTVFAKVDRIKFTAFLVERTFKGVNPGPEENKMGIKGSSTTQVVLEDVNVPVENVLGEIGKGHKIAFNVLNVGRFKLGAAVTGNAKHALVEGVKYANIRKQFGVPIRTFGVVKEKIADMAAIIFASESLIYRLAGMIDGRLASVPKGTAGCYAAHQQGIEEYATECAIAKVFCSEMLSRVADEVVQIHGGYGFLREYAAERYYRDERVNRIFEGTNEINRILITGTLLKRAMRGGIPFQREMRIALEALESSADGAMNSSLSYAAEKALLRGMKHLFLAIAGAAVAKFGDRLRDEQEVLSAMADVAINIFALESAVLRAEKISGMPSFAREEALAAAVKILAFNTAEETAAAARKATLFIEEGEDVGRIMNGIRRHARYDAPGLLQAKRQLADTILAEEKYIFGH